MENSGQPDRIQMTLKSYQLLCDQFPEFRCAPRGGVRIEVFNKNFTIFFFFFCMDSKRISLSGKALEFKDKLMCRFFVNS